MRVAIMQPTFLPWFGYFHLMASVDVFVFLDDVEISMQSWQTRNYFLKSGAPGWISVPVNTSSSGLIRDVSIQNPERFISKLLKTLAQSYAKAPCVGQVSPLVEVLENMQTQLLGEFNIRCIEVIAKTLDIGTVAVKSSDLDLTGRKSKHVVEILDALGAESYTSTVGSRDYMEEFGLHRFGRPVVFHGYDGCQLFSGHHQHGVNMSVWHSLVNHSLEDLRHGLSA